MMAAATSGSPPGASWVHRMLSGDQPPHLTATLCGPKAIQLQDQITEPEKPLFIIHSEDPLIVSPSRCTHNPICVMQAYHSMRLRMYVCLTNTRICAHKLYRGFLDRAPDFAL